MVIRLPLALFVLIAAANAGADERIPIKVVVVAMYEIGAARGDNPGELQFWVERLALETQMPFTLGETDLYLNDDGVLAFVTGTGIPNATASVLALGLDQRFDFSKSYWLVAGIAGGDPEDLSLGSAAWAKHVVDGDLAIEIDGREIPEDWPYGLFPFGTNKPVSRPEDLYPGWTLDSRPPAFSFSLNEQLVDWAYSLTKDLDLGDTPALREFRQLYEGYPAAQRPPFVTIGDTMSSSTFWHGELLNNWANDWMHVYAGTDAKFMTTNMEESGTLTAFHRLAREGLIDIDRVLVLRTVSNFTMQPPGKTAVWSKTTPFPGGGRPALESAFTVGNTVVQALITGWSQFEDHLPRVSETAE